VSGNKYRDMILQEITLQQMSLSQQEFDHKSTCMFKCWIVYSNSLALYFQWKWVEGHFHDWKAFSSTAGYATTNNCVKSFNAMLKRCFMERK
jgi:hypothetical protein